jgi:hypothetical protein
VTVSAAPEPTTARPGPSVASRAPPPRQARTPAGAFIGGAKGRLLPAHIPLRYFGAAVVYHLLAWLALAAGAAQWTEFGGGLGWPLASLHLITLGVLGMSVLGAGAQLLPVASRQAVTGWPLLTAIWWLYTPGVALLALGMGLARAPLVGAGALATTVALLAWAWVTGRNLRGARGMPGVVGHGWAALAALLLMLAAALALVAVWLGWPAPPRGTVLALHRVMAPYGFIGMLTLGLSYVLVPMFVLSDTPEERHQRVSLALLVLALVLAALATLGLARAWLLPAGLLAATAAVGLHLWLMAQAIRQGMRPLAGASGMLVRLGWCGLLGSLAVAWLVASGRPPPRAGLWFGLCLVGVWQLSFLLGMLQRIAPFLAAMHDGGGRRARTPSTLTHEGALRLHCACHCAALLLLAIAITSGNRWVTLVAAGLGAAGAAAFGVFFAALVRRLRQGTATPRPPAPMRHGQPS